MQRFEGSVDRREVPGEHGLTTGAVRLHDGALDRLHRLIDREDLGEREEARLEHGVHARTETGILRDAVAVHHEEPQLPVDDLVLDLVRQLRPDLVGAVGAVEQEGGTGTSDREHVASLEPLELVARDEVGTSDQVRRADRMRPETQVRHRRGAGLLRVVDEVPLRVQVRSLTDDLDGVLVRADGAVAAEPEEDGPHRVGPLRVDVVVHGQARERDVVGDPDREVRLRLRGPQLVEDRFRHARVELLGAEAVPTSDHPRHAVEEACPARADRFGERGHDVLVQGLAGGARFLRAIEYRDAAHRLGERCDERLHGERPEEADRDESHALAVLDEGVHRLLGRAHP